VAGRLEELDDVTGGVQQENLLAAGSFNDVVAELGPGIAELDDLGVDVVDEEVDAVPATRSGLGAVGHRPSGRAGRTSEEQSEVASLYVGKGGREVSEELEAENLGVEGDRLVDVGDHVADVNDLIGRHVVTSRSSVGDQWVEQEAEEIKSD
jgi:hypothetical protein